MIDVALSYNIPVQDVITGKIDLNILRFLDARIEIIEQISELPYKDEKKIRKNINKSENKIIQLHKFNEKKEDE